jgi:hypothetical protein
VCNGCLNTCIDGHDLRSEGLLLGIVAELLILRLSVGKEWTWINWEDVL